MFSRHSRIIYLEAMIIGLAFIESLTLYSLVVSFIMMGKM